MCDCVLCVLPLIVVAFVAYVHPEPADGLLKPKPRQGSLERERETNESSQTSITGEAASWSSRQPAKSGTALSCHYRAVAFRSRSINLTITITNSRYSTSQCQDRKLYFVGADRSSWHNQARCQPSSSMHISTICMNCGFPGTPS